MELTYRTEGDYRLHNLDVLEAPKVGKYGMPRRSYLSNGCMVKAPLALESVGKNPTDQGKNGDKTQCVDR